jgi:hypothetical protein
MVRAIRVLAVAGLVAVALPVCVDYASMVGVSAQGALASGVQEFALNTGALVSFAAGLLTLTLSVPRHQRPWSAALLVSLILNGYWPFVSYGFWWVFVPFFPHLARTLAESPFVVDIILYGLVSATPALLALGYTVRTARSSTRALPAAEEQASLDITVEPMGSEKR